MHTPRTRERSKSSAHMDALKPIVVVRSLKTVGEAFVVAYSNRRRLLPVIVEGFLLNLALTALMVNLASPHVNLDFMRPFFEIADNSTAPAGAMAMVFREGGTEASPSSSLKLISFVGEVFFLLSTIVAILLFSKACNYNLPEGHRPASFPFFSTWREWKSLGLLLFPGAGVVIFISILLEALDLDDELSHYFDNFFTFVYLLTAVISSKEGLYGFSAAEKAWVLVGERFYEITVLGAASAVLQETLRAVYMTGIFLPRKDEVAAQVIREDTVADIFRFSVVAALLTVILQTFQCSVILTFYSSDAGRPTDRQRDRIDASAVIAATHAQPRREAEATRRGPASGRSDASPSNGGRALNLDTRTARPRRQTRPHPKYDPRVWQL